MFDRILIAYDGSAESDMALRTGLDLAKALRSSAALVTVLEPLPGYISIAGSVAPELPTEMRHERRDHLEKLQSRASKLAEERGVPLETVLLEGAEVDSILEAVRSAHADLLVVGLRRHAAAVQWAGTFRHIANESPCPILAVSCHSEPGGKASQLQAAGE